MGSQGGVLSQIQALYESGSVAGLTDAQLVERFANEGGERAAVAFSALVERHGPMVMRVCRASLRNEHDAEDAFQAVFLVLVRKAGTLWVRDSLGPWLHAVAMRTSAYAKTQSERRRAHEWRRTQASHETVEVTEDDLIAAIHEEVGRLPDRFREAVVLCDLEGLSHEAAAGRLGWPVGTVKSRQARGRERLRGRLERRGLAPTDAAFAMAMSPRPVAVSIVRATACAASVFRTGQAAAAGEVSASSKEVPIEEAIGAGTGISGGSALTIPRLLMPAIVKSQALTDMTDLKIVGVETVDDASCTKLAGKTPRGDAQTVWIDKKTSLVRKIFSVSQLPGDAAAPKVPAFSVEQTTTYRPRIDVEIAPQEFTFEPPKS